MTPKTHQERRNFEKTLISGVVRRDKDSMKEIYTHYTPALSGFVRLFLADPNDVADIIHDTMIDVWRNAEKFEGRSSLKTWIFSIAKNKAIDRNRKSARLKYSDESIEIEDEALNPSEALELTQDAQMVQKAVSQLKPDHRRAIHLSYFEGLTYKEIAVIENCPEGTIKTRMLHAKKNLRHILRQKKNRK